MDKISAEHSIRRYLGKARDLEVSYALARAEEIAFDISSKKPFLKSRGIERHIKLEINAAYKVQSTYNRKAKPEHRFYLVEALIKSGNAFVRSKILLEQILKRSSEIKRGMNSKPYYEDGPSLVQTTIYDNSPEMQKTRKIVRATVSKQPLEPKDNTINILKGLDDFDSYANGEDLCQDTMDTEEDIRK